MDAPTIEIDMLPKDILEDIVGRCQCTDLIGLLMTNKCLNDATKRYVPNAKLVRHELKKCLVVDEILDEIHSEGFHSYNYYNMHRNRSCGNILRVQWNELISNNHDDVNIDIGSLTHTVNSIKSNLSELKSYIDKYPPRNTYWEEGELVIVTEQRKYSYSKELIDTRMFDTSKKYVVRNLEERITKLKNRLKENTKLCERFYKFYVRCYNADREFAEQLRTDIDDLYQSHI